MVISLIKPWIEGSCGTPWSFTSLELVKIGNENLAPDTAIDKEGEICLVYLTSIEVNEAMDELGFKPGWVMDPSFGLVQAWEVELMPSVIL